MFKYSHDRSLLILSKVTLDRRNRSLCKSTRPEFCSGIIVNQSAVNDSGVHRGIDEGKGSTADDHEAKQKLSTKANEVAVVRANKIGLTKEQLERYAKDPYWIRIRLALVVTFWIVWIAMFVAAVAIVVLSPKCPDKPPRLWWQKRLCYQIWTPGFADSDNDGVGDLKGIKSKLLELSRIGIQTIRPSGILQNAGVGFEDITSHVKIDPRVGSLQDFDDLVGATHSRGMHVVLDLPVVTSINHPWFVKYSESAAGYSGFYNIASHFRNTTAPSVRELFTVSEGNKSFIPSKRSEKVALLNLEDSGVQTELANALSFWADHGVDGFFLTGASLFQELVNSTTLFAKLRSAAYEKKESMGLFSTIHDTERQLELRELLVGEQGLHSVSFERLTNISNFDSGTLAYRMGDRALAEAALLVFMMLPGSLGLMYGEELGVTAPNVHLMCWNGQERSWSSQHNRVMEVSVSPECATQSFEAQLKADTSYLKVFTQLAKLRDRAEAFLYGTMRLSLSKQGCLIIWRESITMTPNFVLLANMKVGNCSIALEDEVRLQNASEVSVNVMTNNLISRGQFKIRQPITIGTQKTLELQAYEAVILKYT
ncbi:alpha amylase, catalytic domain protein [Trichuris suis]|nr:alpha amylase, catalytic domain protein [Trichuris suis]